MDDVCLLILLGWGGNGLRARESRQVRGGFTGPQNKAFFQFKLVCVRWEEDRRELGEASAIHLGLLPRQRKYTSSGCAFGFGSTKASGCEADKNPRSKYVEGAAEGL